MKEIQLDEVFEFIRNGASIKQADGKGGYPISRIETIWNKTIDTKRLGYADIGDEQLKDYEKYLIKEGDILMTHINSPKHLGKCAVYIGDPKTLIHGMNLLCMRANQQITIPTYIKYFFNSKFFKVQLPKISNQSVNQASFSAGNLKKLKIPLPPLDQQKKIAAILDAADAYRQKTKALIEKYDELTQSLFLDMFGDPVSNPKKLPTKTLGELCEFYSGRAWKKAELGAHGYKLVRISNLHKPSFPYWHFEGEMLEKHKVEAGDLLFSWAGVQASIDSYIYKGDTAMINQHIYNIKPRNEISKLYLYHLLQLHLGNLRGSLGGGVGQFHLKKSDVTGIKVILPNDSEMANYIASLSSINKQKKQAKASLVQAEDLFNSLLQRAFKGELTN